jgi:hypothetical protein
MFGGFAPWHRPCSQKFAYAPGRLEHHHNEEVIYMVFVISYRKKHASSKIRQSFFAQHNSEPSLDQVQALVNRITNGDFAEKTIAFQKCPGFDADELIRAGISVRSLEPETRAGTNLGPANQISRSDVR